LRLVTDQVKYTEQRLKVTRTARWGCRGELGERTDAVWIALHGYAQLAADFAAAAHWPVTSRRAFVFPEALQRFYNVAPLQAHADAPVGATWMTREQRTDDIADNHAYLDALADAVRARAPHAKLFVLGFSQGAATATRWVAERAARGDPPGALVAWGSLFPPDVSFAGESPLRRVPAHLVCGTRDRWISELRLEAEMERLGEARFGVVVHRFAGGHRLDDETLERVVAATSP
jgi:predicted esterase